MSATPFPKRESIFACLDALAEPTKVSHAAPGPAPSFEHRFAWKCENCREGGIIAIRFPMSLYHFDDRFLAAHEETQRCRHCMCPGPVRIDLLPNIKDEPRP